MRDRNGIERGHCASCALVGNECAEFYFSTYEDEGTDDAESDSTSAEEYRHDPLLQFLKVRLQDPAQPVPALEIPSECRECGCAADAHEDVQVSAVEARCLEAARMLFAPLELHLCIRQSVQDTCRLGFTRDQFTYGEVGELSFLRLLDRARMHMVASTSFAAAGGRVFYDLGCGAGKAVVLAALHPIAFDRCVGVELLPGVAAMARALGQRWQAHDQAMSGAAGRALPPPTFVEADLFNVALEGAALILVNAGSWQEPSKSRLRRHLLQSMPDRCLLATIRKPLAEEGSSELVHLEELQLPMSWGIAPVFLAERRRSSPVSLILVDLHGMD